MPVTLLEQIESAGFFSLIRDSTYAYPVLLWLHLLSLAVWGGLMLVTDLRLLGLGSGQRTPADTVTAFRGPKRVSFLLAAVFGVLLFGANAGQYAYNSWFWLKMLLLVLLGVNYLILRRGLAANRSLATAKLAACLSLVLWMGAVWTARGPATIKDMMHAMVDPSAEYLFDSVQIISDELGTREVAPETDEDWRQIRVRADALLAAPDLLASPGRLAARPRDRATLPEAELETEEMQKKINANRQDFELRARKLHEAVSLVMQAIDAKDKDALFNTLNEIDLACEGCHVRYWYPNDPGAVAAAREAGILE